MLGLGIKYIYIKIDMIFQTIIVPAVAAALAEASSPEFQMNIHQRKLIWYMPKGKQNELKER